MKNLRQIDYKLITKHKKPLVLIILALAGLWWLHASPLFFHPESVEDVQKWVLTFGSLGPLVYIGLYAARPFLFFPSLLLNLSSGLLFGPWWGIIYLLLGGLASATVCFWSARLVGNKRSMLQRYGGKWGKRLDNYLSNEKSFIRMLWLRTVPIFPYDPVSVVAGSSSMAYLPYAAATVVGMLPGAIAYNFLADSFAGKTIGLFGAIAITTVAFGIPLLWWYVGEEHKKF